MRTLLMILLAVSVYGCGTRKRAVAVETAFKDVSLLQNNNVATSAKMTKKNVTVTYTPIDGDRPMILPDGRTSTNAKIEERTEDVSEVHETKDLSTVDLVSGFKTNKKDVDLKTEKPNPWLWGAIAVIGLGVVYFGYKWIARPRA